MKLLMNMREFNGTAGSSNKSALSVTTRNRTVEKYVLSPSFLRSLSL
jgi:hypothetical protein